MSQRHHPIPGTFNFRDLGGYQGLGGREVRWGQVFRSDAFVDTGPDGWHQVARLGVRRVIDLRMPVERERTPHGIPDGCEIEVTSIAIGGESTGVATVVELLASRPAEDFGVDAVTSMNHELLRDSAAQLGAALQLIAAGEGATVFHCTAGKDRTGMVAALLLSVLGVDREDVVADYELTTTYRSIPRKAILKPVLDEIGVDIETVFPYLSAPGCSLRAALDELEREFGSIEAYVTGPAGVADATIEGLRQALLA